MAKMTSKQRDMQRAAAERREAKRVAHEAMMASHAARKATITQWEVAYDLWVEADCKGPRPIHPDNVQGLIRDDSDDLYRAAAELGIDLNIEARFPLAV